MSNQQAGVEPFSLPAAADFSAARYKLVKLNTSGQFALVTAATDYVDGIIQANVASGEQCRVETHGILKVLLGGTVTVGALASPNTSALAAIGTTRNATFGKFLDAGVSGDVVRVLMQRGLGTAP